MDHKSDLAVPSGRRRVRAYCSRHNPWTKAIFCSLLQFIHIGFLYNFGLFFDKLRQEFHSNVAITGWVGSLSYCLFTFGTILTTWLLRYLTYRKVATIGVLLGSVSLFVSSFSPKILYLIILYGIFFGMSSNVSMFVTLDFMVVLFEDKRRARAMTVVTLGATIGNLSMSNLVEYILEQVGWRWTFRIFAAILLLVGIGCCSFFGAPNCVEKNVEKNVKKKELKAPSGHLLCFPEAWLFSFATVSAAVAMAFQYVNMASFFEFIGLSDQKSATGISCSAFGDSFAKVLFIMAAPCISFPLIYCIPVCLLVSSVLCFALTQTTNIFAVFFISFCYGMPRGIFNALQLAVGLEVFGTSRSKTSANLLLFWSGIGYLAGPYIHGSLYDASGSYYPALYICTALFFVSSFTTLLTPLWQKYFAPVRYMVDYRLQNAAQEYRHQSTEPVYEQMISVV
ncbi:monocarboxylate transporter 3-like isoform X1 [Anneissia japonica]|uniref:monocarboxylate transporter 3-like isoform X1 n=1 Tax=Anneissia japonica TaxID=1529436 RepID=UPI0014259C77|nr:monocarboxylate transporter 3-like isoform X1 [Anneissia japonica]